MSQNDRIIALLNAHYQGDDEQFNTVALQLAAAEARAGHGVVAQEIRKLIDNRQLSIKHLVELDIELREHSCDESRLTEQLQERGLIKLAARIMQLMNDFTGLTEGFMPIPPLHDRITNRWNIQIENHLSIL